MGRFLRAAAVVALLVAGIAHTAEAASPAESSEPAREPGYLYTGHLAFRSPAGDLIPVVPDQVLVGRGDGACQWTLQSPVELEVGRDGGFQLAVADECLGMVMEAIHHADGSTSVPTCTESRGWPCYRFRAEGCDDQTLPFGPEPPDGIVEMRCPARRQVIRAMTDAAKLNDFATRYTAAWCSQNAASVAAFFGEDASLTINGGTPSVGRAAITAAAQDFMTAFPDMVVSMDGLEVDGHRAVYHWTLVGTNTGPSGTGREVRIGGYEEWTIGADGLIAKSLGHFDEADYRRQLEGTVRE